MRPENLSDFQLYSLSLNEKLPPSIKEPIASELQRRAFSKEKLEELALEYKEHFKDTYKSELSTAQKILVILLPFFPPWPAIVVNRYVSTSKMWKQYWTCAAIGFAIWAIVGIALTVYLT
jgi:sterol desaturase/sphingolipid hydroxylase (fatty acid hydroxylase superfamily)